jgi:hypothetical protein
MVWGRPLLFNEAFNYSEVLIGRVKSKKALQPRFIVSVSQ